MASQKKQVDSTQVFQSLMGDDRKWGIVEMMLLSENECCMSTGSSAPNRPNRCSFAAYVEVPKTSTGVGLHR